MKDFKQIKEELESILEDNMPKTWTSVKNGNKVGKLTVANPLRGYIILSPATYKFLRCLNCTGYITSGAEGTHATSAKDPTHSNGLKVDLQPLGGAHATLVEYAQMCIELLRHLDKVVYINLENFSATQVQAVKDIIYKNYPDLKKKAESKATVAPNRDLTKCDGKVLTSVRTPYAKHLDVAILAN